MKEISFAIFMGVVSHKLAACYCQSNVQMEVQSKKEGRELEEQGEERQIMAGV